MLAYISKLYTAMRCGLWWSWLVSLFIQVMYWCLVMWSCDYICLIWMVSVTVRMLYDCLMTKWSGHNQRIKVWYGNKSIMLEHEIGVEWLRQAWYKCISNNQIDMFSLLWIGVFRLGIKWVSKTHVWWHMNITIES